MANKDKKRLNTRSKKHSSFVGNAFLWLSISVSLIGVAAIVWLRYNSLIPNRKPQQINNKQATWEDPQSESSPDNVYPNYEQYIRLAKEKGWHPIDPLHKLLYTIQKYPQVSIYHHPNCHISLIF
jgi:hypothetical protein